MREDNTDVVVDLGAASDVTLGIPKVQAEESTGELDFRD
jgi:hypothetical protein